MTIFKRFPVAVILSALVILLCCVWGYSRVYEPPADAGDETGSGEHYQAGESNLNYYLSWMKDGAGMFTPETADAIARQNLSLDNEYNSLVAICTVSSLEGRDVETCARELADQMELGGRNMLLLLDNETQDWYVVYGPGLQPYVEMNTELQDLFRSQLSPDFFAVTSNRRVVLLFEALQEWFAANVPPAEENDGPGYAIQHATLRDVFIGIIFTLMTNIWWILILLVALTLLDRTRCRNYVMAHPDGHDPANPFRPLLFWHHAGSRWFADMEDLAEDDRWEQEEAYDEDFPDPAEEARR